jgi:hypothetical protein
MAARMQPSAGDGAAELSLDEWLRERNSSLDALTIRASGSFGQAMLQGQEGLPLAELRSLGWVPAPGVTCAFIAPVGTLTISPPSQNGTWSMASAVPLPRIRLGIPISVFWAQQFVYGCVDGATLHAQLSPDSKSAIRLFLAVTEVCLIGIPLAVWAVDFASVRAGRLKAPLPLKVFYGVRENVVAFAATTISSAIFIYLVVLVSTLLAEKDNGGGRDNSDRFVVARRCFQVIANGLVGSFLLYEAALYAIFAMCQTKYVSQFDEQSQRVDIDSVPSSSQKSQPNEVAAVGWFMRFLATFSSERVRRRDLLQDDEGTAKLELKNLESSDAARSTPRRHEVPEQEEL